MFAIRAVLALSIGLIAWSPADAVTQSKTPRATPQARHVAKPAEVMAATPEPTSFMGVQFGVPVTTQFEDCTRPGIGDPNFEQKLSKHWDLAAKGITCFSRLGRFAELNRWPDLGLRVLGLSVMLAEADSVEGALVTVYRFDWTKMLDLLTAKFGAPQEHESATYTNLAGGERQGEIYTWRWPGVTLSLSEYGSKVDESSVTLETKRLRSWLQRQSLENAQRNKDRL